MCSMYPSPRHPEYTTCTVRQRLVQEQIEGRFGIPAQLGSAEPVGRHVHASIVLRTAANHRANVACCGTSGSLLSQGLAG